MRTPGQYSFAWQGQDPIDETYKVSDLLLEAEDLPSFFEQLDSEKFDNYRGAG